MGVTLSKSGYQELIDGNIKALEEHMPEHSLEKKHAILVLQESVDRIYGRKKRFFQRKKLKSHPTLGCQECLVLKAEVKRLEDEKYEYDRTL